MRLARDRALLIATDIDGTLLDHDAQLPFRADVWRHEIQRLGSRMAGCRVAFASSRTLDELLVLQRALGVQGPCIAEDGAVLARDADDTTDLHPALPPHDDVRAYGRRTMRIWTRAQHASALRTAMQEMDAVQRADASQLDRKSLSALGFGTNGAIRRALYARHHSLLLDPSRLSGDERQIILTIAAARGLQLRRGGRWLTLADTKGKGTALSLLRHFEISCGVSPIVVTIGNEENDVSLLEKADLAFVIRNPGRGPHPALTAIPHAVVLDTEGPGGWLEMLNRLQVLVR
ncbi:HAD hydrolase family protein [Gemmatimonas groenlandica]|uniref:HAD hydrolase family protein n=1 Tax=Gemmatimonas groenlandica TaxID=2732249 RepID=A0A6M4IWM7_9BACT|nr:HAD hydrolase family protein [Gemmatimonas groenlandica]QJR36591.1 HAD hydrolase family protein [Gemmatimonas groenlandica]